MIYAVWAPLLMPLLVVPAARRLAGVLQPRPAAWLLAVCGVVLAGCSAAALALLCAAGALRLGPVAALDDLTLPLVGDGPAASPPVTWAAGALLTACAVAVVRTVRSQAGELAAARRAAAATHGSAGDLTVLGDARPDAFALPGRPGRIVVTAGMLRALDGAEREALFAHERAHLTGRHHLFLAAAELAAVCHPLLRGLRAPLAYALERWADEAAATAVGDRSLTARAIGRAALAGAAAPAPHRPRIAPAAATGPVPRRVAALLHGDPSTRRPAPRTRRPAAAAVLLCLCVSAGSALDAAADLHGTIETAQGESGPR